jgi:hypothetical protein
MQDPSPQYCCNKAKPSDGVKTPSPSNHNARGLVTSSVGLPLYGACGPRRARHKAPCISLISKIVVEIASKAAPPSKNRIKPRNCHRDSTSSRRHPSHEITTLKPVAQGSHLHQHLLLSRTGPATLIQPTASHCKPSRPRLSMPQASFTNVVPHRTDDSVATPTVVDRCKQSKGNQTTTPEHQQESGCPDVR